MTIKGKYITIKLQGRLPCLLFTIYVKSGIQPKPPEGAERLHFCFLFGIMNFVQFFINNTSIIILNNINKKCDIIILSGVIIKVIKLNLNDLLNQNTGFYSYLLGRSYDLEENGVLQDYSKALYYYQKGLKKGYHLCTYSLGISYELGLDNVLSIDKGKAKELLINAYTKILEFFNNSDIDEVERVYARFFIGANFYYNGRVQMLIMNLQIII